VQATCHQIHVDGTLRARFAKDMLDEGSKCHLVANLIAAMTNDETFDGFVLNGSH
jgi:DNA-binding FrmR family transcriptional regulator